MVRLKPETGVFFRWQTNGTSVINFQAHVRNSGISTIVTPSSQPSNWADWFVLEIQIGASGIRFCVNDSPVTPFITTNIPTALTTATFYGLYGWTQSAGNILEVDWDYARPNV
ncbi:MAG: hypothetical protein NZ519_05060 [Bacteroidia bacterium]|nr:hypothetical protein [Bacteroidia bacterium]